MKLSASISAVKARNLNFVSTIPAFITVLIVLALVSCNGTIQPSAVDAVETYQDALVAGDVDQLISASCADWEAQARLELDSFTAVSTQLVDRSCQEASNDGDTTLVSCEGVIKANYGAEVLEINLADRTYQAVYEGGEWRMCGYR